MSEEGVLMPQAQYVDTVARELLAELSSGSPVPTEVVGRIGFHLGLTVGMVHGLEWRASEQRDELERHRASEDLRRLGPEAPT